MKLIENNSTKITIIENSYWIFIGVIVCLSVGLIFYFNPLFSISKIIGIVAGLFGIFILVGFDFRQTTIFNKLTGQWITYKTMIYGNKKKIDDLSNILKIKFDIFYAEPGYRRFEYNSTGHRVLFGPNIKMHNWPQIICGIKFELKNNPELYKFSSEVGTSGGSGGVDLKIFNNYRSIAKRLAEFLEIPLEESTGSQRTPEEAISKIEEFNKRVRSKRIWVLLYFFLAIIFALAIIIVPIYNWLKMVNK